MSRLTAGFRRVVCLGFVLTALLLLAPPAHGELLPPLRVPNLAIGTRCFGFLPCTGIDPFGLRLRIGALAVFRPEKGHDRDFYAARIQIMPAITLMKWAEIGVAIPITLYRKEIGVSTVPEPIEPYGRLRIPLEDFLGGITTTAYVRVRIASGPFVGGASSSANRRPDSAGSHARLHGAGGASLSTTDRVRCWPGPQQAHRPGDCYGGPWDLGGS